MPTTTTRTQYLARFSSPADAAAFEDQPLEIWASDGVIEALGRDRHARNEMTGQIIVAVQAAADAAGLT